MRYVSSFFKLFARQYISVPFFLMEGATSSLSIDAPGPVDRLSAGHDWRDIGKTYKKEGGRLSNPRLKQIGQALIRVGRAIDTPSSHPGSDDVLVPQKAWNTLVNAKDDFEKVAARAYARKTPPKVEDCIVIDFDFLGKKKLGVKILPAPVVPREQVSNVTEIESFAREFCNMLETVEADYPSMMPNRVAKVENKQSFRVGRPAGTGYRL